MVKDKREVFEIYYDDRDHDIRMSKKTDIAFKHAQIRSSIKDQNVYRGFNLPEINYIHRISQGYMDGRISKTSTVKMPRHSTGRYLNDSIHESEEDDSSSIEDPVYSPKSNNDKNQGHVIKKDKPQSKKVNFAADVKEE